MARRPGGAQDSGHCPRTPPDAIAPPHAPAPRVSPSRRCAVQGCAHGRRLTPARPHTRGAARGRPVGRPCRGDRGSARWSPRSSARAAGEGSQHSRRGVHSSRRRCGGWSAGRPGARASRAARDRALSQPPRGGGLAARGDGRDAHPDAPRDQRAAHAHARLDQSDRVDDRVRAAHQQERQALAIGRDGPALERRRDAQGPSARSGGSSATSSWPRSPSPSSAISPPP